MNTSHTPSPRLAFIGGGNMASAILGGLIESGMPAADILVVEPWDEQRQRLTQRWPALRVQAAADAALAQVTTVVWATKPQTFAEAAAPCAPWVGPALHLSVMAGIRSDAIARATGSERVVRAMPNTPALIGKGIAGLYAREAVSDSERHVIEGLLAPTGQVVWVQAETDLDAVTALSGSGPAYVFYFIEAMVAAAERMGLSAEQGQQLALATFGGATELARRSDDPPSVLRERVTSKGGTTHAALTALNTAGVSEAFVQAMQAAQARARELGDEFGR